MTENSWNLHHTSTLPFQGGGLYVSGGTVTIQATHFHDNTAVLVSTNFQNVARTFLGPDERPENCPEALALHTGWRIVHIWWRCQSDFMPGQ